MASPVIDYVGSGGRVNPLVLPASAVEQGFAPHLVLASKMAVRVPGSSKSGTENARTSAYFCEQCPVLSGQ
ncbi:MAG TPA: hypothetical protein DIW64_14115 [Cellvibrio sp.]|nr:hypothetical protein [Cellvibrio sp.]